MRVFSIFFWLVLCKTPPLTPSRNVNSAVKLLVPSESAAMTQQVAASLLTKSIRYIALKIADAIFKQLLNNTIGP